MNRMTSAMAFTLAALIALPALGAPLRAEGNQARPGLARMVQHKAAGNMQRRRAPANAQGARASQAKASRSGQQPRVSRRAVNRAVRRAVNGTLRGLMLKPSTPAKRKHR